MSNRKPNLKDELIARLRRENDCLSIALHDLAQGKVKWVSRGSVLQLGICRPDSASGGVVIHQQNGSALGAYYWESWYNDVRRSAEIIQSDEWLRLRSAADELNEIIRQARREAYHPAEAATS